MRRSIRLMLLALLAAVPIQAFDHRDSPSVVADPSTDITDLFAWMSSDHTRVNLAMLVSPFANTFSKFSGSAHYVFHLSSRPTFLQTATSTVDVICDFQNGSPQAAQCWVGSGVYVAGDASGAAGLTSTNGQLQVFAGLRDDPAFVNLDGLKTFASTIAGASLTLDAAGCPALDPSTSAALVGQLNHGSMNAAPTNFFAGANVLALVASIDASLLTSGGPILGVWASTNH